MKDQDEKPNKPEKYDGFGLQPAEDVLRQAGYPAQVIENYSKLLQKDLHLAEIYRLEAASLHGLPAGRKKTLSPIYASVDEKGRVWVDVLLEMSNGDAIKELDKDIKVQTQVGRYISAQVPAIRLPELLPKAIRIQASSPIVPFEYATIPESIKADKDSLSVLPSLSGQPDIDGRDVIIGIVDIGCDFKHPNFLKQDKTTRLLFLWDQNGKGGTAPAGILGNEFLGNEYDSNAINEALKDADPYKKLGYTPQEDAHGTHVMDIAAGSSRDFPGVASAASLIFVHLGKPSDPVSEKLKTLGSSKNLVDAVKYIFEKADTLKKSVVVNISLGANGGAHDGTSIAEVLFDTLLSEKAGRAIVIAAGNSYDDDIHASGKVTTNSAQTLEWFIQNQAISDSPGDSFSWDIRQELEIWYDQNTELTVKLFNPDNQPLEGECPLGSIRSTQIAGVAIQPVIIRHLRPDPAPGENENHINIFIDHHYPGIKPGNWKIQLTHSSPNPQSDANFHAWVERNDEYPSQFVSNNSRTDFTINTIANGRLPIVVGSYNAREAGFPISYFSSEGPSRNQNPDFSFKPELTAPGWNIFSARATYQGGYNASGTSMAAPHVTGLIALMFQAARDRRAPSKILNMLEIRKILMDTADKYPPEMRVDDPRYEVGRVNGLKALSSATQ